MQDVKKARIKDVKSGCEFITHNYCYYKLLH